MMRKRVYKFATIGFITVIIGVMAITIKADAANRHEHVWDKNYEVAATCEKDGISVYTCACEEYKIEGIQAKGHQISLVERKDATCKESGWEEYEDCTICGVGEKVEIPPLEHVIMQYPAQEPTCASVGWKEYEACTLCDYTTYEEISVLEHANLTEEILREVTCETVGITLHICLDCGKVDSEISKELGHDWGNATITSNAIEYTCERCYETKTESTEHEHIYSRQKIIESATCKKDGLKILYCACGDSISQVISKLGHDYENGICRSCGALKEAGNNNTADSGNGSGNGSINDNNSNGNNGDNINNNASGGDENNNQAESNYKLALGTLTYRLNKDETGYICTGIEEDYCNEIIIPDTYNGLPITEIAKNTFVSMYQLHRVTIGANITKVGDGTFYDCPNLVEVYNLSSVQYEKMGNLRYNIRVTVYEQDILSCVIIDNKGFVTYKMDGENYLIGYIGEAKTVSIPQGVTIVSRYAFANTTLEEITVTASVKELEAFAFKNISKLKGIIFENKNGWYWDTPSDTWTEEQISNASLMANLLTGEYASKFIKR